MGHLLAVLCLALLTYAVPDANAQLTGYRRVHSWGSNRFGELGIDHVDGQSSQAKPDQCEPDFVPTLGMRPLLDWCHNLQRIISGQNHVVAITEEGNLYVWGRKRHGAARLGFADAEDTRTRLSPPSWSCSARTAAKLEVIDAAVGLEHTVVLINGGRVYSWGSNQYGQLGIDVTPDLTPFTSVPTPIDVGGELVMNVSAAAGHSVALSFTGGVYTWGANQEGQLGLGGCSEPDGRGFDPCLNFVKKPTKILRTAENSFMPQMKLIAAGGHVTGGTEKVLEGGHTVSVSLTNEVWGWGDNFHGQVGKAQEYTRVTDWRCTPRTSSTMSPESTTIGKYCLCASVHCGSLRASRLPLLLLQLFQHHQGLWHRTPQRRLQQGSRHQVRPHLKQIQRLSQSQLGRITMSRYYGQARCLRGVIIFLDNWDSDISVASARARHLSQNARVEGARNDRQAHSNRTF